MVEVLVGHLIHRHLRPDEDPVPVGHLQDLGIERVVRPDHLAPGLPHLVHHPAQLGRAERGTRGQALLVHVKAPQVERAAVQPQPAIQGDRDAPHAAVGRVPTQLMALAVGQVERRPI